MGKMPNEETIPLTNDFKILPEKQRNGESTPKPGVKLDDGKPMAAQVLRYFARAFMAVSEVGTLGYNRKYKALGGKFGSWKDVEDGEKRYDDAAVRHILYEEIYGINDLELPVFNQAQVCWDALAKLEFMCKRLGYPEKSMQEIGDKNEKIN
jgi:hypothetical protein